LRIPAGERKLGFTGTVGEAMSQFGRAVVARRLQLESDALVTEQPQALLREGRTADDPR
jgi:hypothetical protein